MQEYLNRLTDGPRRRAGGGLLIFLLTLRKAALAMLPEGYRAKKKIHINHLSRKQSKALAFLIRKFLD
jgi:hypothetical protein